jgi:Putative MetA-pathway of phenol degradation
VCLAPGIVSAQGTAQDDYDLINPDRPGIADGSKVIAPGALQVEAGLERDQFSDTHVISVPLLVRVGVVRRLEARVEGNTFTHTPGATGFSPISIGAKVALIDTGKGPTLGVIVRGFLPSGTSAFKTTHVTGDVRLAADIPLGSKFSLNPNAGVSRLENDAATAVVGLFAATFTYQPTDRINPFIDVSYVSSPRDAASASFVIDGGIAWILGSDVQLDFSVGQGVHGDAPRPFVAGGLSWRFPRR